MSILSSIQKIALTPSVFAGNLISKGITAVTGVKTAQQTTSQLQATTAGKVLGTAIAATGTAALLLASPTTTSKIVSAITPTTIKGKVIGATAGLVVGGAVASNPKIIPQTISGLANFGTNIGEVSKNPTSQGFIDIVKENPVISAGVGLVVAGAVGKGVGGIVASALNTAAIRENTAASQTGQVLGAAPLETAGVSSDSTLQTDTQGITPQATQSITSKPRKRRKSKSVNSGVRQSVKVNIVNTGMRITNKKYLNEVAYV